MNQFYSTKLVCLITYKRIFKVIAPRSLLFFPMNGLYFSANIASLFGLANEEKATHTHCFFRSTLRNGHSTQRNGRSAERNARSTVPNEHFIGYR